MASMSTKNPSVSSSSTTRRKHDVFVSFRTLDTRMGFVDHLNAALLRKGILPFTENDGDSEIFREFKVIQESTYAVVVISPNYCSSRWCLAEITEIMECTKKTGLTVLPVFYRMDPSDVRTQTGAVGDALAIHEDIYPFDMKTIQKWRATLTDVGNIAGWIVDDEMRDESAVLTDITTHILNQLPNRVSLVDQLVGIGSRVAKVMDMFGMELNGVRFVGICGLGGTGKTTLAKAVYDRFSLEFEASSFISSIRKETWKHGLASLQNRLISDILSTQEINMHDLNLNGGVNVLRNQMRDRKILIILDDVNSEIQLEALVGSQDWFGLGSRIVLTSRDDNLLRRYADDVYEIEKLNNDEALELFSWSAFKQPHPDENYVALSEEFITYARGVPLTLKVLGFSLSGRRIDIWKSDLDLLRIDPNKEILRNWKYRYDCCGNQTHKRYVEAIDFRVGILAFLLEFALLWVANSEAFERVVLVVSWIYCLATWTIFIWEARSRGAHFALPRWRLPNQQPYGCGVDYFDKYAAIALVIFSTVQMFVKFSGQKFSTAALVLSAGILGAKLGGEHQKSHSD